MIGFWKAEAWRILILVIAALVLGAVISDYKTALLLGALSYLAWHVYCLTRLARWSSERDTSAIPEGVGIWGIVYDRLRGLTKKHQNDMDKLQQELERYRQATMILPDGAVTLGANDEIELINENATALLGLKDPQDMGSTITNLIRDPDFLKYLAERDFSQPLELPSPVNHSFHLSITVVPYGDAYKKLLLVRDVTRLHKLEEIRRDFVANVSHEMKSPLTVIKGYVESMLDDTGEFGLKWKKALSQVDQQTDRMCRIVEDLLELSNLETGPNTNPSVVDVPSLIRSIYGEALELSNQKHDMHVDLDNTLFLRGHFNQLYSAFSNLVINAVKYTPAGGTITIRWFVRDSDARFSVSDTGPGIQPEHIPRLTERFYRVDTARSRDLGGTGLGLAIVKHVLLRHDARLFIESEIDKGSQFSCTFPSRHVVIKDALPSSA